jgi:predicted Zn-ribbon and HTH transcriptional regulator
MSDDICFKCNKPTLEWFMIEDRKYCKDCRTASIDSVHTERVCKKCGHKWVIRVKDPIQCPQCHVRIWNRIKFPKLVCRHCSYEWQPHAKNPSRCPRCGKQLKTKPLYEHECMRCGHVWSSSHLHPQRCVRCTSWVWRTRGELPISRGWLREDVSKVVTPSE